MPDHANTCFAQWWAILTVIDLAMSLTGPLLDSYSLGSAAIKGFGGITLSPKQLRDTNCE